VVKRRRNDVYFYLPDVTMLSFNITLLLRNAADLIDFLRTNFNGGD